MIHPHRAKRLDGKSGPVFKVQAGAQADVVANVFKPPLVPIHPSSTILSLNGSWRLSQLPLGRTLTAASIPGRAALAKIPTEGGLTCPENLQSRASIFYI